MLAVGIAGDGEFTLVRSTLRPQAPEMKSRRPTVARIGTRSLFKCYHSTRQHGRGYHVFELGLGADGPSAQTIGTQ